MAEPSSSQRTRPVSDAPSLRSILPAEPTIEDGTVLGTKGTSLNLSSSTQFVSRVTPVDLGLPLGAPVYEKMAPS